MVANQRVLQAWTEVCHQIFGGWEVQTMWNLQKNVWYVWKSMFSFKKKKKKIYKCANMGLPLLSRDKKTFDRVKTQWHSGF